MSKGDAVATAKARDHVNILMPNGVRFERSFRG